MVRVRLVDVDDVVLEQLVEVATRDAAPDEVTPPLTPGPAWTPGRVEWLRAYHRDRRPGLDGPYRERTWAVLAQGDVVGSVRLRRVDDLVETGIWLARSARGRGVGRAAMQAVIARARRAGVHTLAARTTATNHAALALLARGGFRTDADARGILEL